MVGVNPVSGFLALTVVEKEKQILIGKKNL